MKKRSLTLLLATAMTSNALFSSCIGSFDLTSKLLTWNRSINSKSVSELVSIAFQIIPVYEISALADTLVINPIEFWSGSNPVADVDNVETIDGRNDVYTVETEVNGYHIQREGDEKAADLVLSEIDQSWNVEANGESTELLKFNGDDEVVMYLLDDKEVNVKLSQAGVSALQQVTDGYSYYTAK